MIITKENILNQQIINIYQYDDDYEGYPTSEIIFELGNGIKFSMPIPQMVFETREPNKNAFVIPDVIKIERYKPIKKFIFFTKFVEIEPEFDDMVKIIKSKTIKSIMCPKLDDDDVYTPEDASIILNDNSQIYCISCAPPGIPIGIFYENTINKSQELISFFDIPIDETM